MEDVRGIGQTLRSRLRAALFGESVPLVHHEAYRLPFGGLRLPSHFDPRRANSALAYLLDGKAVREDDVHTPVPISYQALARVHSEPYLERVTTAQGLAEIFALPAAEIPTDELLRTLRVACGGTLLTARLALSRKGPALNLLGGFHHAAPGHGGGFCAINDVAVAIAALRAEGFAAQVGILDLDAHPPDGTAACLPGLGRVWMGSLSGADFGALEGVDEIALPHAQDEAYLEALGKLLERVPACELVFVLAGGDVLDGDHLGNLRLTLAGARARDVRVFEKLRGIPSAWLPAGGYGPDAWRVLAGTGLVLCGRSRTTIPAGVDPVALALRHTAEKMGPAELSEQPWITQADLDEGLAPDNAQRHLFLGFYSREGILVALTRFGFVQAVEQLGYEQLRVDVDGVDAGDRLRVWGQARGAEHLLVELVASKKHLDGRPVLFVEWLTLRHPLATFGPTRPQLPGQQSPGLGLAHEITEVLGLISRRLSLSGVAFRPSWYHMAVVSGQRFGFADPARQQRFEAMQRDLAHVPLLEATRAVAAGQVRMDGAPYTWEPAEMVWWLDAPEAPAEASEPEQHHFELAPA